MSQADAEKRVADTYTTYKENIDDATLKAKEAADTARKDVKRLPAKADSDAWGEFLSARRRRRRLKRTHKKSGDVSPL